MIVSDFCLLIVSRSRLIRYKIARPLRAEGFRVLEASGGKEALASFESMGKGAIMLGEHLTDMDAEPFLQALRQHNPAEWPKIVLVGTEQPDRALFRSLGVRYFLFPPLLPRKILLKAKAILDPSESTADERHSVEQELRKYQRLSVPDLNMHLYEPAREISKVLDISYCGLKIQTQEVTINHQGCPVKMQLVFRDKTLISDGRVMWVRKGEAGISFGHPKPPGFQAFFDALAAAGEQDYGDGLMPSS